jgi:hypothetical protein
MSREGVHIIDARRLNAMQAVCDTARIWSRSQGGDKSRAEQSLLRALATWEESQREEEVSEGATHA